MLHSYVRAHEFSFETQEYVQAKAYAQRCLDLARTIGHQLGMIWSLADLGRVCDALLNYDEANTYFIEALQIAWEMQAVDQILDILTSVAMLWTKIGQREQAVELLALILHQCDVVGYPVDNSKLLAKTHLTHLEDQLPAEIVSQAKIQRTTSGVRSDCR